MPRSKNSRNYRREWQAEKPAGARESVTLDEFLNSRSISNLQRISTFWSRREHVWHSKLELIRLLRTAMLDRRTVAARIQNLPEHCPAVLRSIIKAARKDYLSPAEAMCYDALENTGFIERAEQFRRTTFIERTPKVLIPLELRELLIDLLDVDVRLPAQVISLARHLETLPADVYEQTVAPVLTGAPRDGSIQTDLHLLTQPERIKARIGTLPAPLRDAVTHAITMSGGFQQLELKGYTGKQAREPLEAALIGTVSELPVPFLERSSIIVFTELTDSLLDEPSEPVTDYDVVHSRGPAAVMELNSILQRLAVDGIRTKMGGGVYKSSVRKLSSAIGPNEIAWSVESVVEAYLYLLQQLGLTREQDEEIIPTDEQETWFRLEPDEQLRRIIGELRAGMPSLNSFIWNRFIESVKELPLESPTPQSLIFSRTMLAAIRDSILHEDAASIFRGCYEQQAILDRFRDWLDILAHYGVVDEYLRTEEDGSLLVPVAANPTELGALALGRTREPQPEVDSKILIANPDFEVIVFRHGPDWRVAAKLGIFADCTKVDQTTYHFKITRQAVEAAVLCGLRADDMLALLNEHSRAPIPQNIEYSINDWAAKVQIARTFPAVLLEVKDAATLDFLMEDPAMKGQIIRRLSPTLATVKSRIISKKMIEHLRQNGIFFRK
ncbi:MAG TPA: helicase-associated domain-containing protein [Planctomycetota bacterium]|nr:helicase-associated domain-containing protein [Planctomycetota bacterium]